MTKRPRRLPTVLTKDEVRRLFLHLSGVHLLMARPIYGSGLRLMECLRLRIQDARASPGRDALCRRRPTASRRFVRGDLNLG